MLVSRCPSCWASSLYPLTSIRIAVPPLDASLPLPQISSSSFPLSHDCFHLVAYLVGAVIQDEEAWQLNADGTRSSFVQQMDLIQGPARWIVVRSADGMKRALQTARKQADKQLETWTKKVWHVSTKSFACQEDAQQAWEQSLKGLPAWLDASVELKSQAVFEGRGRPARDAVPNGLRWSVASRVILNESKLQAYAQRKACFVIASNVVDEAEVSTDELMSLYLEQGSVERGFRFLKDPLFLASSVFVKKPARIVALSLIMVLALLVYRLAEHRLREQLMATGQTIPNQVNKPTARPTMRWVFQCFEGIELLHIRTGTITQSVVLRLQPLHQKILSLLGPAYQQFYFFRLKLRNVGMITCFCLIDEICSK